MKAQGKPVNAKQSLHVLQHAANGGKENLVGGRRNKGNTTKTKNTNNIETKKPVPVQEESTVPDIFSEEPNTAYWKVLADRRREALEEALNENRALCEKIELLEDEISALRELIDDSAHIINYVHDAIHEEYGDAEVAVNAPE